MLFIDIQLVAHRMAVWRRKILRLYKYDALAINSLLSL